MAVPGRVTSVSDVLAQNKLGVGALLFAVWVAATPLTVVTGVVPTGFAVTGLTGLPLAFILVGIVLLLFSVGYVAMSRRIPNAGAFYAYLAHGIGKPFGVAGALVALVAYNALQVGLYGIIGAATGPLLEEWFAVTAPWWVLSIAAWLITTVMGQLDLEVNKWLLVALLLAEIAVVALFSIVNLLNPAGGSYTMTTLSPGNLFGDGVGAVAVMAVLGFIGFEATAAFSEEVRDRRRTVPLATYLSVLLIAVFYTVASFSVTVAVGPDRVVETARSEGPEMVFNLAGSHLGSWAVQLGHIFFVTGVLAALVMFHQIVARYTYALGRERLLPGVFGRTARNGAPWAASLLQTAVGITAITITYLVGWDPVIHLFFVGGTGGAVGILLLLCGTALAVIGFFARHREGENAWQGFIAPLLAFVALAIIAYFAFDNLDILLGVGPDHPLRWIIPVIYIAAAGVGFLYSSMLRVTRPTTYHKIGLGPQSVIAPVDAGHHRGPVGV